MSFASKIWLLMTPLCLAMLVFLILYARHARAQQIKQFASKRLLHELLQSYSPAKNVFKNILIGVALFFVLMALARPQWGYVWTETKTKGIDILFLLDASKSMLAEDIKPNRLERSKFAILDFVNQLESDRIGLIAFAGNAFLQCPLTLDYDAFRQSLDAIDTHIIPSGGTDISAAINGAENTFSNDANHKIVVLITDGEDLEESGIKRAQRAAKNGIKIYTVGVGTKGGGLIPIESDRGHTQYLKDENGQVVKTKLDEATLNQIATATGGFYTELGATGYGLQQVYAEGLRSIPQQDLASRMERTEIERFQWPLGIAILLLFIEPLISNRRFQSRPQVASLSKATAVVTVLFFFAFTLSTFATLGDKALKEDNFDDAITAFEAHLLEHPDDHRVRYNLGLAHFEKGELEEAIQAWELALNSKNLKQQADTLYNLGSAKYRMGQSLLEAADSDPTFLDTFNQNSAAIQAAMQLGIEALTKDPAARKEAWDQCEAVVQKVKEDITQAEEQIEITTVPIEHWERSLEYFKSVLDLVPEDADATHNQALIQKRKDTLKAHADKLQSSLDALQKSLKELEALIEELKKPTSIVVDAQKLAEHLIKIGEYQKAYSILAGTAQKDPTAEVYQDKQQRVGQIVGILENPEGQEGK